jgi:hypothetical protein
VPREGPRKWARIERVELDLYEALFEVVAQLEQDGIEHALVGALAVAVHGAPRATTDIDLLVDPKQADAAVAAVKRAGFPLEALPQQFRDGMRLRRVTRIHEGEALVVDLILADPPLDAALRDRAQYEAEGDRRVWVVTRDALVAMKLQAGRAQDIADVERLQELDR